MSDWGHLARRFAGSLRGRVPSGADEAWAREWLLPGERSLWEQMPGVDRHHAVGVARRVITALGTRASRPVVAAALLHDVGKIDSGLGTFGRAGATLAGKALGRSRMPARSRAGRYLRHDEIGAGLLAAAGSDPLTVAWAAEHHRRQTEWSAPRDVAAALKAADDD